MPYSDPTFDKQVENFILEHKFRNYIDIGAGAGKYGKMIKKILPKSRVVAIEANASYIKKFKLNSIYDRVYCSRIETFFDNKPDFKTDIAIIGDCLEHLKKSDGEDLINYLMYRSRYILIVFPSKYIQYSWRGHKLEAHMSVWSKYDFLAFEHHYYTKKFMNLVIIRGYIGDPESSYPQT
ncbi:MAG: hypothetical protein KatS3mg088_313 [Patescibacteria group bacterium]|nr:MAG: hypothetical protein KatS3mg088_313 [Patescibacteria group bacterium]